jgi:hypothetical protein
MRAAAAHAPLRCPDSPRISEDSSWVAKASLDDTGHWGLDDRPTSK